jgi:hypothetical protein
MTPIVVAFGYIAAGLSVDLWSGHYFLPLIPLCAGLAWFYRKLRPDPWIEAGAETVAQVMLILVLGTLLSYAGDEFLGST